MGIWNRFSSAAGPRSTIAGLGVSFVVLAAGRFLLLSGANRSLLDILATDLVIAVPGVGLLYGAHRIGDLDLRPDVYPRILSRCLVGIGAMLAVVGLLAVTGLNRPLFTPFAGAALGAVAGFAIDLNEARALSRARDAEQAQRELEQTVDRLRRRTNASKSSPTPPLTTSKSRSGWCRAI